MHLNIMLRFTTRYCNINSRYIHKIHKQLEEMSTSVGVMDIDNQSGTLR